MNTFLMVVLLIASEALGLAVAEWYYRLFLKAVPPAATSGFNIGAAHAVFLAYGLAVGAVFFAWAMLAAGIAHLMGRKERRPSAAPQAPRAQDAESPRA